MRSSPRETGLWLWCPLPTGNLNVPRKATWTEWLNGHLEVWRAGNGSCNLQGPTNTVPTVDLGHWCSSSRELQVIHPEKPDQRHKSGPSQYIHTPRHCIHQGELGLLKQLEDELWDTTRMVVTSTPGEACGINRAITLRGKCCKKPWWRHLHPSHISVTNRPWIMTRGHG